MLQVHYHHHITFSVCQSFSKMKECSGHVVRCAMDTATASAHAKQFTVLEEYCVENKVVQLVCFEVNRISKFHIGVCIHACMILTRPTFTYGTNKLVSVVAISILNYFRREKRQQGRVLPSLSDFSIDINLVV